MGETKTSATTTTTENEGKRDVDGIRCVLADMQKHNSLVPTFSVQRTQAFGAPDHPSSSENG